MASGTISGGNYNNRYSYYMTWSSVADVTNNRSNVTLNWIFKKTATDSYNAYNTSGSSKVTLVINGSSSGAVRADFDLRSASVGTTSTIASYTVNNIPHNSDGTLTINVSGSHTTGLNWGTFSIGNTAITLDTIPRASTFTISKTSGGSAATSWNLGEAIYVNITRASSSFTHKVYFKIGSSGNQVLSNSATTSANTTLANSLAQYIPSTSGTATMYVDTYNGSTLVGSASKTFTINVPSSVVPSINSVTKTDTAGYLSTHGAYVQGKSNLRVQTSASGNYSTITNYTVQLKSGNTVLSSKTGSDVTFSNISYTGTITVLVTVTDSRGRTATNSSTITVATYENPKITLFTAERLNNDETITIKINASITNVNNHNSNAKNFYVWVRESGTSSWGSAIISSTSSYTYNNTSSPFTINKDADKSWDFLINATDSFTTTSQVINVGTAFQLMNWKADGTAMAVGKVSEKSNTFEVGLDTDITGKLNGTSELTVGALTSKNLFNSDAPSAIHSGITWAGSGNEHYLTSTISWGGGIRWYFLAAAGNKYTFSYRQRNSTNLYLYIREKATKEWTGTTYRQIVNDGTGTSYSFTIENNCYLEITFQTGAAVSNVLIQDLQLEKGLTKTAYTPFQNFDLTGLTTINGYPRLTTSLVVEESGRIDNSKYIHSDFTNTFKDVIGANNLTMIRKSGTWSSSYFPSYSTGVAWIKDAQGGFIIPAYSRNDVYVGGVSDNVVTWTDRLLTAGQTTPTTWTPTLNTREGVQPTVTYTNRTGYYVHLGNMIFFDFYIRAKITALNGTDNYATVSGLPYNAAGHGFGGQACSIGVLYSATNNTTDIAFIISGGTICIQTGNGSSATKWKVTTTSYMEIGGSGWYFVA